MRIKIIMVMFLFLVLFLLPPTSNSAKEDKGNQEIEDGLLEAEIIINQLAEDGFNTQRAGDILKAAKQIYESQKEKTNPDYTIVIQNINDIVEISKQAYLALDEVSYARKVYLETKESSPQIDLTDAEKIINEMEFEFDSERYEEAIKLAKSAYSKVIELEGKQTAARLALSATQQTIKNFLIKNWWKILIIVSIFLVLFTVLKGRVYYIKTKWKISNLERDYKSIEELIKKSQKEYFERGTMSEAIYRIRINKFSELMRDINRQIPLLKEELAKWKKTKKQDAEEAKSKTKTQKEKVTDKPEDIKEIKNINKQKIKQENKLNKIKLRVLNALFKLKTSKKDLENVKKERLKAIKKNKSKIKKSSKKSKMVKKANSHKK